jgi:hypothetical protein
MISFLAPCFPANRSESFFFLSQSNATTDGVAGEATYSFGEGKSLARFFPPVGSNMPQFLFRL